MANGVMTVIGFNSLSLSPANSNCYICFTARPSGAVARIETGCYDNNWYLDEWEVVGYGPWVSNGGNVESLYSAVVNDDPKTGGSVTFYNQPADDIEHDDVYVTVTAKWAYRGTPGGEPPAQNRVTVTVVSSSVSGGTGTVAGTGVYPVGASYTVSGTPSDNPRSVVTKMTSSLGADISYRNQVGEGTRSESATATQNVTWTVEFARVYAVSAYYWPIAGGASSAPARLNCSPTVSGYFGTTTLPVGNTGAGHKTGYLFVAGEQGDPYTECTIDANPNGNGAGSYASVVRFRTDQGGNFDGQLQAIFTPTADTEYGVLCFYDEIELTASVTTDGDSTDGSGGSVSLSKSSGVMAGDQVTVTATVTAGVTPVYSSEDSTVAIGEERYRAGKSSSDNIVIEYFPDPKGTVATTTNQLTATATIQGRDLRTVLSGGDNLPSWFGMGAAASAGDAKWFAMSQYHFATAYFYKERTDYGFIVNFSFETYGSHGAVWLVDKDWNWVRQLRSGEKILKKGSVQYVYFGTSSLPYSGSSYFCYGVAQGSNVLYSYPTSGGVQLEAQGLAFQVTNQGRSGYTPRYSYRIWVWPKTTNKILYRQSDGAILCGSGGSPMAQFVDVQQQGA